MRKTVARLAAVGGLVCVSILFAGPFASATPSASLTIVSTAPGWGGNGEPLQVEILAKGPPPREALLANSQGLNEVQVTVDPAACRHGADVRYTSLGKSKWCLKIGAPSPGSSVSGTIAGKDASVILTVSVRTALLGWPLLAAIGGFIVGILVAFMADLVLASGRTRRRLVSPRSASGTLRSLLLAIPTAVVAVISVVLAVYLSNATFGSGSNYWSLLLATASSASAASIASWVVATLGTNGPGAGAVDQRAAGEAKEPRRL
jgi:hypothetical protein